VRRYGVLLFVVACGGNYYDKAPPMPAATASAQKKDEGPKRPAHVLGKPVPEDIEETAWGLLQRCGAGEARACTELGTLQASPQWNARDDKRAAELFGRGCDGNDAGGCESLAEAYAHGRGVARDLGRSRELHEQACHGQRAFACAQLGAIYAVGYGVTADFKRAKGYLQHACEDGDSPSCELKGAIEGCERGEKEACGRVDKLKARYEKQDADAGATEPSSAR
jgi:TPR repeat protein